MIAFQTEVRIDRPADEVFAYVSDPLNFPRWNSAIETVRKASVSEDAVRSTYVMERQLPSGRAVNELEVVASEPPHELVIRATAGPTPFVYRYWFTTDEGETVVTLDAQVELPGAVTLLQGLARRAVKSGVDDNLVTLKHVLEADGR